MPATLVNMEVPALTGSMVTLALVSVDMRVLLVERVSRTYIYILIHEKQIKIKHSTLTEYVMTPIIFFEEV